MAEIRETSISFDKETHSLTERLYQAWSTHAPVSAYIAIRNSILSQREQVDTRIATLSSVAKVACSNDLNTDSRWDELFALAGQINARKNGGSRKRKRAYNESNRLRNFALVAALWSPDLAFHYGWNTASQIQMNLLRACAVRYPCFNEDFRPRLNCVLLERHCLGIKNGRVKTLDEAPLQPHRDFDLATLASAVPNNDLETQWITNEDGHLAVDAAGTLLKDLRPNHFRRKLLRKDQYGLLISRNEESAPPSSQGVVMAPSNSTMNLFGCPADLAEPYSSTEAQSTLQSESLARPNFSVSPGLSPLPTLVSNPEITSLEIEENVESSDSSAAASNTASTLATSSHEADVGAHSGGTLNYELHDLAYEQFALGSSFDFDLDTPVNLPGLWTSSWRHNSPRNTIGQGPTQQPSASLNLAHGSFPHLAAEPLGSASPGSLLQSPERPELSLTSPPIDHGNVLTVEEALHNRYRDMITSYVEKIASETKRAGVGEQPKLRAQWLSPATRWASVWTQPESGLPRGRARSSSEADVLYLTSDELTTALQKGRIFRKPLVVKEKFSDSGMHTLHTLACLLQNALIDPILDVRRLENDKPETISIDTLLKNMRIDCHEGDGSTLNLRNITRSHRPLLTMLPRFRLLDSLVERARDGDPSKHIMSAAVNRASCISFNTLSFTGAFSGAHLDAMGGMWMRNLNGVQFWTMVPEEDMGPEWETFAKVGRKWVPNGKHKFLILEQDDALLIPPGLRVVHAMHSPTKGLMEEGILWDGLNVVQILHSIYWVFKHQVTRDETITTQSPRLIAELEALVKHQPDQFLGDRSKSDFMLAFEQAISKFRDLGCTCSWLDCEEWCTCRREGRQCTTWCAAHLDVAHKDCMQERHANENDTEEGLINR
ncbi:MAG: hypothetical protein L6R42_000063 [Xanthoria sp. 1 TBL-2021]|nr:MAG: hypothetical protein L6R42_000063 [Xanthoria sp. 1 TBL-2021]